MKQLVIWRMAMTSPRDRNGFEHGPCGVPVRGGGRLNGPFPLVGWLVGSSSLLVLASSIDGSASSILRLCILSMSILHASPLCRRRRQLYTFVFASKIEWVIQPVSGRVNEQP